MSKRTNWALWWKGLMGRGMLAGSVLAGWLIGLDLVWAAEAAPAAAPGPVFRAGFAERDITPELGMEQPGGYMKAYHKTLHDPCKVRAAVFDDGKKRVALVGLDAGFLREPSVVAARKGIQQRCGIPPEAVMIAASHSHSSGPTGMVLPGEYDHASDLVKKLAYELSSGADPKYLAKVEQAIVDAVCAADAGKVEVQCSFGRGFENQTAFNRRFRMKNGRTHTHPGQGNPDILCPAGPTDPEVGVIGAWDKQGKRPIRAASRPITFIIWKWRFGGCLARRWWSCSCRALAEM
jgi:hypothetical protein